MKVSNLQFCRAFKLEDATISFAIVAGIKLINPFHFPDKRIKTDDVVLNNLIGRLPFSFYFWQRGGVGFCIENVEVNFLFAC